MANKRTLDTFFTKSAGPPTKKARTGEDIHPEYPFPIAHLPPELVAEIADCPTTQGKEQKDQPELDLLLFMPYIPAKLSRHFFDFLREELPFYRVQYSITRNGIMTSINTPR